MLVYGDRSETVDPRAYAEALAARCDRSPAQSFDLERHAALVESIIDAGKLAQGLADLAFEAEGRDDGGEGIVNRITRQLACEMACSWKVAVRPRPSVAAEALNELRARGMPDAVTLKTPEGYAFYAVYPELYLTAAERFARGQTPPAVVGLRSIGTSLAAAVSAAGAQLPITLRPHGDPFDRRVTLTADLRDELLREAKDGVAVVDEGPGASGSSFGAVGDFLEDAGVPPQSITYMPSHPGDLGPQASDRHRARWKTAKKAHANFEDVILPRLPTWVEPLIGRLEEPLRDLSGGLWRGVLGVDAPAWPEQERRKYLAVTEQGRFLLKFAGLGDVGWRKLERARALASSGVTLAPLGLAHGFLVEPLVQIPASASRTEGSQAQEAEQVACYLGFRARHLAPPQGAASDDLLRTMMRRNFELASLPELAEQAGRIPTGQRGPPCAIDGRLHAWEWRRGAEGRLIKLDALDHCEAHDLVGAQDLAWDIAGAAVELGLEPERLRRLAVEESGQAIDPRRVAFQTLGYLAFQIGWWTLASQGCEGERAARRIRFYEDHTRSWRPV